MRLRHTTEIPAPNDLVWRVYTDVERWPQWMESMDHVDLADSGGAIEAEPLRLGGRVWISQPRLPSAMWEITELTPGRSWTWVSRAPGATSTATHELTATGEAATRVDTSLTISGPVGALVGLQAACAAAAD